jgi:hypothetical protein
MYQAVLNWFENTISIIKLMEVIFTYLILYNEWTLDVTMHSRFLVCYAVSTGKQLYWRLQE